MKQAGDQWNVWSIYWLIWLLAFLGPELYAVFANPYNTLSWQVWHLEGTGWSFWRFFFTFVSLGLGVFLTGHFGWRLFK